MTDYALKLLKRQEDRAFIRSVQQNPVAVPPDCGTLRPPPSAPPPPPAEVEDAMHGEIAELFDTMANPCGGETTLYDTIRAGFDNGNCATRRGTWKRFRASQRRKNG